MKLITLDILVSCGANRQAAAKYVDLLNELLPYYTITTWLRTAHFLSQVLHESNGMRAVEEYASGAAYEGRKDLGNVQPGDGIRFKGRGLMQVTGRSNYTEFARLYDVDCLNHPELLTLPRWALATALWYWNSRKLNNVADQDNVKRLTKIINGGYNGLAERTLLLGKSKAALKDLFE